MYEFEYDKKGYLIRYVEKSGDDIDMHCSISGSTVIKYESDGTFKSMFKYNEPVKVLQRFEAGESWLTTVVDVKEEIDETKEKEDDSLDEFIERKFPYYYKESSGIIDDIKYVNSFPTLNKQLSLENDIVYDCKFKINHSLIKDWKNLVNF